MIFAEIEKKMNLTGYIKHLSAVYGQNNAFCLSSWGKRKLFFEAGVFDLNKALRKRLVKKCIAVALARIFARFACLINGLNNDCYTFPFAFYLSNKYPVSGCGYCIEGICLCDPEDRRPFQGGVVDDVQIKVWGLRKWQLYFKRVYGNVNERLTVFELLARLDEEFKELCEAFVNLPFSGLSPEEMKERIGKEAADVFAFICALANHYDIDLQDAVDERYGRGCSTCHEWSCHCLTWKIPVMDWNAFIAKYV
jgi:NTP pyrophosphatase (non-canonical NTP hydrolase)